jgi:outer membrane protein assembly factor BamB
MFIRHRFAAARDGTVVARDEKTGATRGRAPPGRRPPAGADERTVAGASEEGEVVALEAQTGAVRWRARVSSEVLAPPAIGAGLVLVRSIDNRVFAADLAPHADAPPSACASGPPYPRDQPPAAASGAFQSRLSGR